jgi:hypothetical protein
MKFTVIGHCSFDVYHHSGKAGTEERKLGGIFLAVAALASLAGEEDSVQPVFGVGEKDIDAVKERCAAYTAVDTSSIFPLEGETNEVHFYRKDKETAIECAKNIAPPIPFSKIKPCLSTNGILLNMISGSDITLDTLDEIRLAIRERNIPFHLDLHNLTLGVNADTSRFRRALSDWRRWCFMIDSVQMNEEEAAGLTMERYDEEVLAKQMLPLMVKGMCITRGGKGATLFRQDHKQMLRNDVTADVPSSSFNDNGCGDVFGAAFLFSICKKKLKMAPQATKMTDALAFAHDVAHEFALEGEKAFGAFRKLGAAV